jgi:hypothetical protein
MGEYWRGFCEFFFSNLFTTKTIGDMAACFRLVEKNVTPKMNANLLREFMREERAMVLQQMSPLKAPGPDGFSAGFYKKK